jgi:hypothetical protein
MHVLQLEYRYGALYTPLAEFERTLLKALELIGVRAFPSFSPVDMLEGVVQGGPGPTVWEAGVHESNQWILCPPPARLRDPAWGGGRRCLFANGSEVDTEVARLVPGGNVNSAS